MRITDWAPGIVVTCYPGPCSSTHQYTVRLFQNGVQIGNPVVTNSNCQVGFDLCGQPVNLYDVTADDGNCSGATHNIKWTGGCGGIVPADVHATNCYGPIKH